MARHRLDTHFGSFSRYVKSASQAIREWFAPPRRRPIRNARAHTPLHLESLEDRTLLSASVSATVANNVLSIVLTDAAADTSIVSIHRKSSDKTNADFTNLEISLNGTAQSTTYAFSSFTSIQMQAGAGKDTLTVDQGNGNLDVPVTFLAGTGSDTYSDTDASMSGVQSSGNVVLGDQLHTQLNNLQTSLGSNVYNQPLPVVVTTGSNALKDVGQADIMGTFSTTLQNALDNTSTSNPGGLASSAGPADIQNALFAALGPGAGGANLLQTMPGDTNSTPVLNDVVVVANDGTFSYEMKLANQNQNFDTGTLLDFNPGLAGLPLSLGIQSQGVVQTKLGYSYDFKFDIAASTAASIDNSTTLSHPLLINLNAALVNGYEDTGATLGLLNADITDRATNPTTLTAQYQVSFFVSGNLTQAFATVSGAANIGLHMVLSMPSNQLGPDSLTGGSNTTGNNINLKFDTDMTATWNFGSGTGSVSLGPLTSFGSQPTVSFSVSMDANTFFQNFVKPIVTDDILPEFKSVQSLADALDYKVPVLGFGLDNVLDNAALSPIGNFRGFFESIHKFQVLSQDLASFPTVIGQVDLGSFSISQDVRVKTYGPNGNDYVSIMGGDVTAPTTDPITQLRNLVNDSTHLVADLSTLDSTLDVVGEALGIGGKVNFFDMISFSVQFGLGGLFKNIPFTLLQFPMLQSPVNIFNMMMNHHESLLTWNTVPVAMNVQNTFVVPVNPEELPGGAILLTPQISFTAHFAGGFDTRGLEVSDPNQGYYLTDANPTESDQKDISTVVDQLTTNPNYFQSTFMRLTVAFSVDAGFSTDAILADEGEPSIKDTGTSFSIGIGITFAGDIIWKPDDPDTSSLSQGLETPFSDRSPEQQVMRPAEILNEFQNCGGTLWVESGDLTFGFNFVVSLKIFYIPIFAKTFNLVTFKIADFNTPPCDGMGTPALAHMGNTSNNVTGPYAAANPSKELAGTLYLNTSSGQPTSSKDTSQDDTFIIKALANNADGTDNLLVISQGQSQEFDNVHAIYADGGGGKDSFIIKPGVKVPAVIRDGNGNDHLEYDGSGSASLYAGDGTPIPNPNGPGTIPGGDTLIGGTGNNILFAGNGNNHLQATGPGTGSFTVGNGDNTILGGSGTQTIVVGNGNNDIEFGSGNSTITLGTGANTISGKIKGGHVSISDPSGTDTDHTGNGLVDQLILKGTANPDNVNFSTGTLSGSPAVQIDDGTANSTWSVTAQNINTISFNGGGNSGAVGRDGDKIIVGDLSTTGVATVNIKPDRGQIFDHQKDAFTVLGTTHADNMLVDAGLNNIGVAVTGLGYTVNFDGMDPAYNSLAINGNGGNDTITVGNNSPVTITGTSTTSPGSSATPGTTTTTTTSGATTTTTTTTITNDTTAGTTTTTTSVKTTYARVENSFKSLTVQGGAGGSSDVVVSDDADFTLSDTALTRSTGGTISLNNVARANLTGGLSDNHFHVLNWSGTASLNGAGGYNTLQGPDASSTWKITGTDAGTLDGNVSFVSMQNLVGGSASDVFQFYTGGQLSGMIDGGDGIDTLDYSPFAGDIVVDLALGTATNVGKGVTHIENVTGSLGNSLIVGDSNPNQLIGGAGRNVIIGGGGADQIFGGGGDNILIGDSTIYDQNLVALSAINAEWTRTDLKFEQRMAHLRSNGKNDGRLNGSYVLNKDTVISDGSVDTITDGGGLNWVFVTLGQDVLTGKKPGDHITVI
jgi:hypothetical protein